MMISFTWSPDKSAYLGSQAGIRYLVCLWTTEVLSVLHCVQSVCSMCHCNRTYILHSFFHLYFLELFQSKVIRLYLNHQHLMIEHGMMWKSVQQQKSRRDTTFTASHSPPPALHYFPEHVSSHFLPCFSVQLWPVSASSQHLLHLPPRQLQLREWPSS